MSGPTTGEASTPSETGGADLVAAALSVAEELRASDVHIAEGQPPWIRHGGTFGPVPGLAPVSRDEIRHIMYSWGGGPDTSDTIMWDGQRWRLTCFESSNGLRTIFRRVPSAPPPLESLGLPAEVSDLASLSDGLIVTAGSTGSGKTTTLASLVNHINVSRSLHILTIEDPVEYLYPKGRSMISQRHVPIEDQRIALSTALRSDPDVVFLGECRLVEHFEMCLTLAATGHLVLTTVHARDASTTCERIAAATGDSGRASLAQTLRAVISQRLIPDAHNPTRRHVAAEVMINKPVVQQWIRPGGDISGISRMLRDEARGMDRVLVNLVKQGRITAEAGRSEALDIAHFDDLLGEAR